MGRGRKGTGVEPRANDYRIRFTWNGKRYLIPVALKPCAPHFLAVKKQAAAVQCAVEDGTFTFERFFPESPHARKPDTPTVVTLATYGQRWRDSRTHLSKGQRVKDKNQVAFWVALLGAEKDPGTIVPSELEALVGKHLAVGASHRNNMLTALRGIFGMWVKDDPKNRTSPAGGIGNATVMKTMPDPYDLEDVEIILADMKKHYDERIYSYYEAAFFSGLRPEEEIVFRWTKVDRRRRTGRIDVARHRGEEKGTKNYEVRDVEFNDRAWAAIERMRPWTSLKPHGCVFENPKTGMPWVSEADQRDLYWTPTLKRVGLRHRRAYQTRSTCATMMLMAGMEPPYCAEQLGHSVIVFFTKYAKWINSRRNAEQRAKFNAALARAAGERAA